MFACQFGFKVYVTKKCLKLCIEQPLVLNTLTIVIARVTRIEDAEHRVEIDLADASKLQE